MHIQSVNRLLTRRGTTLYSLKSVTTSGLVDSNYPTKGSTKTYTTYSLLSYPGLYKKSEFSGDLIKVGDIKLYVDPTDLSVVPKVDDIIVYGSDEWKIKNVIPYLENDTVVLYILQIRK